MWSTSVEHAAGSAQRRRQRRLRQWLRHERMTVAMALAEVQHHAAPRGQRPARARGEEEDEMSFAMGQTTPPPNAATTEYYPLTPDEGGGMAAGGRPSALAEPRPQAGIQQHAGIGYELVFADAPMLHFHDEDLALNAFLEQVTIQEILEVEVPSSTVSGRFLEQEVDVPVRDAALPDVSGLNVEQMVDVPVAVPLVLDQLVPQERAQQRSVEQVVHAHAPPATFSERIVDQAVDVPVPCVAPGFARVLQHETPPTRSAAAWLDAPQEQFEGVFRTFSPEEKARQSPRSRVRHCCRTPACPRHQLRATFSRTLMATCGSEWTTASGRSSAPTSSGTSRGDGDPGGSSCCTSTGAWPCSVARGQGLGIPWPLLGCPCRPRGRYNILGTRGQGLGIP